jgi:Cu-processing system permease protein
MSPRIILIIARKELRDALRNRWFLFYTMAFSVLALAMAYLSLAGSGMQGLAGFGRTTAGLVNLVILLVPLMGLSIAAPSLAGEQEQGTLAYLLAQPITRFEALVGKYLGLAASLTAALAIGFGICGLGIAANGDSAGVGVYLTLVLMTFALGFAMLSVGILISTLTRKAAPAIGLAIVVWLCLTLLSDLGLMGSALAFKLRIQDLFGLALINPLQVFKMSVLHSMNASLDVLGPAGIYATQAYGRWLFPVFIGSILAWIIVPFVLASMTFSRKSIA